MRVRADFVVASLAVAGVAAAVFAQIEGGDRGVSPLDSSGSFEVSGIDVDVAAKTAEAARLGGWRLAQRKGWAALWGKMHGGSGAGAPVLSDSALDGIVAGIVVDDEQIGPNRYVAKLGVLFDRARAGQILGVSGDIVRSPPMLVIPVMWSAGTPTSFETRNEWQKAWARYRAGSSPIDYVRPSGTGADPLLLNIGQTQRPGRIWWRGLLDQYGAADVLVPQVQIERAWPGGPVTGRFSARHGPDNRILGVFTLRVGSSDALPAMLDDGVRRIDRIYTDALVTGGLQPDPSLIIEQPIAPSDLLTNANEALPVVESDNANAFSPSATTITVQFVTADAAAVGSVEATMRAIPGVRSSATTSLAIGGTSVMRVDFSGDLAGLRNALTARGFIVEEGANTLRIRKGVPAAPKAEPATTP